MNFAGNSDLPATGITCPNIFCGCTKSLNGYCADANDQTNCNTQTKQCENQCLGNAYCGDKGASQTGVTVNNGANCNVDGTCANCQPLGGTNIPSSPNCGVGKEGLPAITGGVGTVGQTQCGPYGICNDPFNCVVNSDCSNAPSAPFTCSGGGSCANCQVGGSCVPCVVIYTTTTCGPVLD